MAAFGNANRANNGANTVTELIADATDDIITISSGFIIAPATSGLIDGGAGTDILNISSSNLTDVQITGIEATELANNGENRIEADQIVNLGTITLVGTADTNGGQIRLEGDDGDIADFTGLVLVDDQVLNVNSFGFGGGITVNVDFSGASFSGTSYINFAGGNANDNVTGGSGDDIIAGNAGDDTLRGGAGDDSINGGAGVNLLQGGSGNDTISASSASGTTIEGGADNDTIIASSTMSNSSIDGGTEIDTLQLSTANLVDATITNIENTVIINTGQQRIEADQIGNLGTLTQTVGVGTIRLEGDSGDVADFSGVSLVDGQRLQVNSNGFAGGTTVTANFAGGTYAGSSFLDYDGLGANDNVTGGDGNDQIDGNNGDDTLRGGAGDDSISGGSGANLLQGDDGNDTLIATSSAATTVEGGANDDTIRVTSVFTGGSVDGGDDTDQLELAGANMTDATVANIEATVLTNASQNRIEADQIGNLGSLTLEGTAITNGGDIRLEGDSGDVADFSVASLKNNEKLEVNSNGFASGTLTVDFSGGVFADSSFVDYTGFSANDSVIGGVGGDQLDGNNGDDTLRGGLGDDSINGGAGVNNLFGDGGNDTLISVTSTSGSTADGGANDDTIRISSSFVNGSIDGGADTDQLELTGANLTDATIANIEGTVLQSATENRVEADQIAQLGTLTQLVTTTTIRLEGDSGDAADFSGVQLVDGQELTVNSNGFTSGTTVSSDFSAGSFTGSAFIDYNGQNGADFVKGGTGNDEMNGGNGNDSLEGGFGNDTLHGQGGDDTLRGDAGDDLLINTSSTLNGLLDGGEDNDLIDLNGAFTNGAIVGGNGNDTVEFVGANYSGSTFASIEAAVLTNTGGVSIDADQIGNLGTITLSNSITNGRFTLQSSNGTTSDFSGLVLGAGQILNIGYGTQPVPSSTTTDFSSGTFGAGSGVRLTASSAINTTVLGGSGDDTLTGSSRDDSLVGNAGDDSITGGAGDNRLEGGDGNDTINNNTTATGLIDAGANDDLIDLNAAFSNGVVVGGTGNDTIEFVGSTYTGTTFADIEQSIITNSGSVVIDAAQVQNLGVISLSDNASTFGATMTLSGLSGQTADFSNLVVENDEKITVNFAFEGNGLSTTVDLSGATFLGNSAARVDLNFNKNLTAIGGTGDDTLDGNAGNDSLVGNAGDDLIRGSSGNNTLEGGIGNDTLVNNGSATGTIDGGENNDLIDLNTQFQNGSILGGLGDDTVEVIGSNYTGTSFSGIEHTIIMNNGAVQVDAAQIANLGSLTLFGGTSASNASVQMTNASGQTGDFSDLILLAGERMTVTLSGATTGDSVGVDVSAATFDPTSIFVFSGTASDDTFVAGTALDDFRGSTGSDTISYVASIAGVTVDLGAQTVTGGYATGDVISNVENVIGSVEDDLVVTSSSDNSFDGGDGTDVMEFNGNAADYTITTIGSTTTVVDDRGIFNDDGSNTVTNVEILRFADQDVVIGSVETPTISITQNVSDQNEGDTGTTAFTFTLTRVGSTVGTSNVDYTVEGILGASSAEASDFVGGVFPTGTVTFNDGEDTKTLTIEVVGDTALESDEDFRVVLSNPQNADLLTSTADGRIQNDDATTSTLGVTAFLKPELGGSQNALAYDAASDELFVLQSGNTISVIDASTGLLDRTLTISGGSSSFDLQILPEATTLNGINVAAGSLISINNAGLIRVFDKSNGDVLASLTTGVSTNIVGGSYNAVTDTFFAVDDITNEIFELDMATGATISSFDIDDVFSEIISFGDVAVDPATGDLLIVGSNNNTLLRLGTDGDLKDAVPLPFGVNSLSGIAYADSDEVWVTETGGDIFKLGFGIGDPFLDISRSQSSRVEGDSGTTNFTFNVSRSGDTSGTSTVEYEVRPVGTNDAVEADDFVGGAFPTGTVTFFSGETSKNITIEVQGDTTLESNEVFEVVLLNPTGAILPVGPAPVSRQSTIINDDASTTPTTVAQSFDPSDLVVGLVGLAHDESAGEIFVYAENSATISVYDDNSTGSTPPKRTIPVPDSSGWGDMDVVEIEFSLGGTTVPKGSLLYTNGQDSVVTVFALDPTDGTVLASLTTGIDARDAIGMTFDQNTGTLLFLDYDDDSLQEVDPATGAVLQSVSLSVYGYATSFGDVDIDPVNGDIFVVGSNETSILHLSRSFELIDDISLPAAVPNNLAGLSMINDREAYVAERTGEISRIQFFDPATFPSAVDDVIVTDEDTDGSVNVITGPGTDTDPENDPLTVIDARDQVGGNIPIGVDDLIAGGGTINISANGDVVYSPGSAFQSLDDGESSSFFITYTISDGNGGTDEGRLDITVNGSNDAPVVSDPRSLGILENNTLVGFVGGSDVDGDALTWSITGGADQALFTVNPTTGQLSFLSAPDFETPEDADTDNNYEVQINVSDGDLSAVSNITVNVVNQNEQRFISINNVSQDEGDTGETTYTFTISLTEAAATNVTFDARITSSDADASDFGAASPLDTPIPLSIAAGETSTTFDVIVTGDTLSENSEIFTVDLENIIGADAGDTSGFGVIVNDDGDNNAPIAVDDDYMVDENGSLSDNVLTNDTDPDGDPLTATVLQDASSGVLNFTDATGAFTYTPHEGFVGEDTFTYQVSDGQGGVDTGLVTITVNDVNEVPTDLALSNQSVDENAAGAVIGDLTVTDPDDGDTHSFAVDDSRFEVVAGQLKLKAGEALDHETEATVDVQVTATDLNGAGLSYNETFTITVNDVNEAPVFTNTGPFQLLENSIAIGTVTATDVDNVELSYSIIGGSDSALFDIDPDSGALSFKPANTPDFESPADADGDNVYEVEIRVSDGEFSDDEFVFVEVLDEDEGGGAPNVIEGTDARFEKLIGTALDDEIRTGGGRLDFVFGGLGADEFVIEQADDGVRQLVNIRDYEVGADSIDLMGREISSHFSSRKKTFIFLENDSDVIVVNGASDISQIEFDNLFI